MEERVTSMFGPVRVQLAGKFCPVFQLISKSSPSRTTSGFKTSELSSSGKLVQVEFGGVMLPHADVPPPDPAEPPPDPEEPPQNPTPFADCITHTMIRSAITVTTFNAFVIIGTKIASACFGGVKKSMVLMRMLAINFLCVKNMIFNL